MRMAKKGESLHLGFTMLYVIAFMALLLIMGFALYVLTGNYLSGYLSYSSDIPEKIYAYRAINTCLAYQDPTTGRFYPGVIDFSKYNEEVLNICYTRTDMKSFNFELKDITKNKQYNKLLVGFGASLTTKSYPVLIRYDDGSLSQGTLMIGVS
jgi:hypothetical protein